MLHAGVAKRGIRLALGLSLGGAASTGPGCRLARRCHGRGCRVEDRALVATFLPNTGFIIIAHSSGDYSPIIPETQ